MIKIIKDILTYIGMILMIIGFGILIYGFLILKDPITNTPAIKPPQCYLYGSILPDSLCK